MHLHKNVIILDGVGSSFFEIHVSAIKAQNQAGMINLSYGLPRPPQDIGLIGRRALNKSVDNLFAYDSPQGNLTLCRQVAQMLVQKGLEVTSENLIITNGSEQALSLAMNYYLQRDDWVIVEAPTYHGCNRTLGKYWSENNWYSHECRGNEPRITRKILGKPSPQTNLYY